MHVTTSALVLRETAYRESDKILTLLTREFGKRTAAARGCRKKGSPLAAGCQLLCWSELVLFEYRGRWTVQEARTLREFRGVREDLSKLALGCYVAELTEALAEEELPNQPLLSLALNSLHALDCLDRPLPLIKAAFELRAMCLAGYEPMVACCAVCGREPEQPRFHLREGALHCAACRDGMGDGISLPLTRGALEAVRHVVLGDPRRLFSFRLEGEGLEQLEKAAEAYSATQLERGFGTLDFYKRITCSPPE